MIGPYQRADAGGRGLDAYGRGADAGVDGIATDGGCGRRRCSGLDVAVAAVILRGREVDDEVHHNTGKVMARSASSNSSLNHRDARTEMRWHR